MKPTSTKRKLAEK